MSTIRKRGSSYRIEKMYKGERYNITIDHKPTKAEAEKIIHEVIINSNGITVPGSFEEHAKEYMESKSSVLSPSTIRGYSVILRNLPQNFKNKPLKAITQQDIQILINDLSRSLSPKTVRNINGFISTVIRYVQPSFVSTATLPQKKVEEFYVPEKEDVKRILEYVKGTRYEIPFWLAAFGLRRSETCALLRSDLKDNTITVNKALVVDDDGNWIVKTTKTTSSTREVIVSDYVADLIRALPEGRIYTGNPGTLNEKLQAVQKKLGIPKFRLHLMRHFFASTARETMGDAYVEEAGGWKHGSQVMKKVYDYAQKHEAEKAKKDFAKRLGDMFGT